MKKTVSNVCVDAGMIMVGDLDYLKTVDKKAEPVTLGKILNVSNGKYQIDWRIKQSWNGDISGSEQITIKSGKLFICDPCYIIGTTHDEWLSWLDKTDYGKNIDNDSVFIIDEMGGDGCYKVELDLEKI
jgi:hypothetical protein